MIGKEKLIKKLEAILKQSQADETEIVYHGEESGLTRYANSMIHQNVYENNRRILFRAVLGKRIGVASTNSMLDADLLATLNNAIAIASTQRDNGQFPGLPRPARYKSVAAFDKATASFTPMQRARVVQRVIKEATKHGYNMAGAFSTSSLEIAVLNSNGLRAYHPATAASINMIAMSETSSGYAARLAGKVADIDATALAKTAVEKCQRSENPQSLEPGEYEVILEPAAIAGMFAWLTSIGFGSRAFQQGTSFLAGRIGRKLTSEQVTIYDNALDPRMVSMPFDFEGVPRRKVVYLDKGVAKGVVHDRQSAVKSKTKTTGHALPATLSSQGAIGINMIMSPGKTPKAKLISGVKRGILVTRFHYINGYIDTRNSVLTGMTRDGTFLIENGQIIGGIKNLRFTDSFLRAFKSTVAVSKETELLSGWWGGAGCILAPTVHLGSFKFSGKTEF